MAELLTAAQMRAVEQAAIDSGEVTGLELMERAGRGVVEAIFEEWPDLAGGSERGASPSRSPEFSGQDEEARRAIVLCGPGNNGGDGFVIARILRERGWQVEVFLYGDAGKLPADARVNYERWDAVGVVRPWPQDADVPGLIAQQMAADLIIDALFGTGLTRGLDDRVIDVCKAFLGQHEQTEEQRVVAVDLPSGLCSDSGRALGWAFHADLTVSFHSLKHGHFLAQGPDVCCACRVCDIGLGGHRDPGAMARVGLEKEYLERRLDQILCDCVTAPSSYLGKDSSEHKFNHGHALVLSGPPGQGGAARMAARGALRIGAGLVSVGCPMRAVTEHAIHLNAIMVRGIDGTHGLTELLEDDRINALCLGPGLGLGPATADLVRNALAAQRGTVLDAEALSRFQRNPDLLFDALHENCVLTPHGGEFARLFPEIAAKLKATPVVGPAYSKVDATREAAARAGCVVLFKGADTVIASPDGRCSINAALYDQAAPWLATAGAGDVLAGMITGLMARGFDAMEAAQNGAWLHTEAARSFGPGLIAEDLPEELPKVFRSLGF